MQSIAILITCFNRVNTTLKCLKYLYNTNLPEGFQFDVYLVDDNSPDYTGIIVKENFPQIKIIQGTGSLFWNRGMHLAWETAASMKEYDFYLWLNDDVTLFYNSMETIINASTQKRNLAIISGSLRSKFEDKPTYGGSIIENKILKPNGELQEIKLLNGNFVLVPKIIFDKIGLLDSFYHHGNGDFDYGLRARKEGFKLYLTQEYVGYCERHDDKILKCYDNKYSIIKRIKFLNSPSGPNPRVNYKYYMTHYSWLKAFYFIFITNLKTLFPFLSKKW